MLALPAAEFNAYLKDEGIDNVLQARRENGTLDTPSRERYAKFPKSLLQVGDTTSNDYATVLGYEAEIVPMANPYALPVGGVLPVQCPVRGKPLANAVVFAGGRGMDGTVRLATQRLTTDGKGVVRIRSSPLSRIDPPSLSRNYPPRFAARGLSMSGCSGSVPAVSVVGGSRLTFASGAVSARVRHRRASARAAT